MATVTLSRIPATMEELIQDRKIQSWLTQKGWVLEAPCMEWKYWHIELGQGAVLPITQRLLLQMYLKEHPEER